MSAEVAMWRAVIHRAIEDATSIVTTARRRRMKLNLAERSPEQRKKYWTERERNIAYAARLRNEARRWLLCNDKDFKEVCHNALLDPDYVFKLARQLKENGWERLPHMRGHPAITDTTRQDDEYAET